SSYTRPPPLPPFPTRRSSDLCSCPGPSRSIDASAGHGLVSRPSTPQRRAPVPAGTVTCTSFHVHLHLDVGPTTVIAEIARRFARDRKSTRLNSSHEWISYAVF